MKHCVDFAYYPGGRTHALTMSYDDGQIHDRRLVEIFDKYGIRGTFHLNAGKLNQEPFVSTNEVSALYKNHEVSCHTYNHPHLTRLADEMIAAEMLEDRKALEAIVGQPVKGMSYPFGDYDQRVIDALSHMGVVYARTVNSHGTNKLPHDFMQWHPTCHHKDQLMERLESFLNAAPWSRMPLLYVWGHSYEFDRENNWDLIEEFCERASGKPHIWYATSWEIYLYIKALRGLHFTADLSCVYNPSALSVWISVDGQALEVPGGQSVRFDNR